MIGTAAIAVMLAVGSFLPPLVNQIGMVLASIRSVSHVVALYPAGSKPHEQVMCWPDHNRYGDYADSHDFNHFHGWTQCHSAVWRAGDGGAVQPENVACCADRGADGGGADHSGAASSPRVRIAQDRLVDVSVQAEETVTAIARFRPLSLLR